MTLLVFAAVVSNPAEVARNRMMNNGPTAPVVLYTSIADCVSKTYKGEVRL